MDVSEENDMDDNDLRSFVLNQVEGLSKKIKAGEQRQEHLENTVRQLENANLKLQLQNAKLSQLIEARDKHTQCLQKVERTFASALAQVADFPQIEASSKSMDNDAVNELLQATPLATSTPAPEKRLSLKRKNPPETMTRLYQTMEDLDTDFREAIRPFYKKDNRAKSDMLNHVRRAFVKYRASTILDNNESITPFQLPQILTEGAKRYIWSRDMIVGDGSQDIEAYLLQKLRNEKKGLAKRRFREETRTMSAANSVCETVDTENAESSV